VTIRVTIRADALPSLTQIVKEAAGNTDTQVTADNAAAIGSHVLSAPGSVQPQDIEDRVSQDLEDSGRVLPVWLLG
jgi:hypothetical protein